MVWNFRLWSSGCVHERERMPCNRVAAVHGAVCVLYVCMYECILLCAERKMIGIGRERERERERRKKRGKTYSRNSWARYFLFGMSWMTTSSVKGYMTAAWCYDWLLPLLLPFECIYMWVVCMCVRAPKFQNYYAFFCFFYQKKMLSRHVEFFSVLCLSSSLFFAHKLLTELMSILPKYSKRIKLN